MDWKALSIIPFAGLLLALLLFLEQKSEPHKPQSSVVPEFTQIPDFTAYTDVKKKKRDFFQFMLPMVRSANDSVIKEREEIDGFLSIVSSGQALSSEELARLEALLLKYRLVNVDPNSVDTLLALSQRADTIPASLVLAQAANESAWGTSRFARNGNNFFGIWCYTEDCGDVPRDREEGKRHKVSRFRSVQAGVDYYFYTLNSHPAYQSLREIRAGVREAGLPVTGDKLAAGLLSYSERREAYVEELRAMIRVNNLEAFSRR